MERRDVWRSPRVHHLMDSLYRGYPVGAILLWETTEERPETVSGQWQPTSWHGLASALVLLSI